jgi:two-component system, NarL family, response regulator NreC
MYAPIKIVIADDHEIYRKGFRTLLKNQEEVVVVGEAENGKELIEVVGRVQPDVAITDIKMPVMDGIEASRAIREKFTNIRVIALSMFNDDNLIIDMLEAGARGYLLKNTKKQELLQAAKDVVEGRTYYCHETSERLIRMIAENKYIPYRRHLFPDFTEKEKEIMMLICKQHTNKEIAQMLNLSPRTIEGYREKIQEKTESRNSVGIAIYAIRHNIFQL